MKIRNRTVLHWPLVVLYAGLLAALAACGVRDGTTAATPVAPAASATPVPTETPALRLEDGAVETQDKNHVWIPIVAETTFDLIGKLESTNPWMVTGNTFAVRDSTQIAEEVKVGDLVEVKGVILEDATWLASSIGLAQEQIYPPTLTLVGKVNSIDPWVVSGMMLPVTIGTRVADKITPGTIVRANILLLEKGSWDVASLVPLSNFTDVPGCATVMTTVTRVNGNEVQFAGCPVLSLGEDVKIENEAGDPATLSTDRPVLLVICPTDAGRFTITTIVVLKKAVLAHPQRRASIRMLQAG